MAINPVGEDLKRFMTEDSQGPVVMLNLLRFVDGGRARYDEYLHALAPFAEKYGAKILYGGDGSTVLVAEPGQSWDAVLIVQYPSRVAFSRMVADPAYQRVTHLRTSALREAVLQATLPWPA